MKQLILLVSILCFVGIFNLPYGYYTLLRIAVTGLSVYLILNQEFTLSNNWRVFLIITAILFNPILPIYLDNKLIWQFIDGIVGVVFLLRAFTSNSDE